ncbi:ATP synthase subunit I [Hoeflea sp.]|uniref:ATP synthase subunit I n=1 Tax=Hoeflea sp. TaxID=1940281 RepID=UPI003B016E77
MAASLLGGLELSVGGRTTSRDALILLYFTGGLIAFVPAIWAARRIANNRQPEKRFAASFVCLSAATIAVTAGLYAISYKLYYVQWHGDFLTTFWFYEFAVTAASAAYQFAVIGLRNYLPLGPVLLAAASIWLAKSMR